MDTILRSNYLAQLDFWQDKQVIKIITGVRRCGKSTLMQQFQQHLLQKGVAAEQIVSLNFEDIENEPLCDYLSLYNFIKDKLDPDRTTYLFFDEIQQVKDFQKTIDSLFVKPNIDIYITGSNANLLSSELATLLSGRYIEIKLLPLSFKEYISAYPEHDNLARAYRNYVQLGSFPYTLSLENNPEAVNEYLEGLFNTVVLKDIITRKNIVDPKMLDSVVRFAFDNIGNAMSTKRIADTMTSLGRKIDVRTVERYLSALEESFILYHSSRYDIKGKQFLKTIGKYYIVDPGLRIMLLGSRKYDTGHVLENIVYLELLRRYKNVYIGKCDNLEVDFVCVEPSGLTYFQVAETTREEETLKRELTPLNQIHDHYPKYLLTLDEDPEIDYNGIRKINVLDWLTN